MAKRHPEYQYLDLLQDIMKNGAIKHEFNTGIAIKSVFGRQIRFDLSRGFPLLTTKKVFMKGIIHELLWFLNGDSNIKYLVDNDVHIWDEWPYKNYQKKALEKKAKEMTQEEFIQKIKDDANFAKRWGELGPVYGVQWRRWPASDGRKIDQLLWAIEKLKKDPDRKHYIVSAWNPEYTYEMALPGKSMALAPCHTFFHLNISNGKLHLQLYQRSADIFLGVPFNIASYALLTMMIAQVVGLPAGDFVHTFGDVHIYGNHYAAVREQLKRKPRPFPKMTLNPKIKDINKFKFKDFQLTGYNPFETIKADITVVGGFREKDRKRLAKKIVVR